VGTGYGTQVSFTTNAALPTVTTAAISAITTNSATSGGNVTATGGGTVTERGVVFGTSTNPTVTAGTKVVSGSGTGTFTSALTGLNPGTTYHVRAYATNSAGTGYGAERSFTTLAMLPTVTTAAITGITSNTAAGGGEVLSTGGANVTERGVVFATSTNPTLSTGTKLVSGSGIGSFTSALNGLLPNVTYYVRAYATNSVGTGYGTQVSFTTNAALPTVTTAAISAITTNSATSGGNVTATGGGAVTERGVVLDTSTNPTVTAGTKIVSGSGTGTFTSELTGLNPGTTYHVRAYATNSAGTGYGPQLSFTTSSSVPTVNTLPISGIGSNQASGGGTLTSSGGATITEIGLVISTTPNPTVTNASKVIAPVDSVSFTLTLDGLANQSTYYVRAFATSSFGTGYGDQVSFTTITTVPPVITGEISGITLSSASGGGHVTGNGGAAVTERGLVFSKFGDPARITGTKVVSGSGTGTFTAMMNGLAGGTTYYVRAYATNSAGTGYGAQVSFTTLAEIPTVDTLPISGIGSNLASGGGILTSSGGATITELGLVISMTPNPTVTDATKFAADADSNYFTVSLNELAYNTTYYVRAFATNVAGTGYGDQVSFTTITTVPPVITGRISGITTNSARGGGHVTGSGGADVTERGLVFSKFRNPDLTTGTKVISGSDTGTFTVMMNGLAAGTTYYVRAYAINSHGTGYGTQTYLTTQKPLVAPGDLDFSLETGASVNSTVRVIAHAGDGKVYMGGDFSSVRGFAYNHIARLNEDGSLDTSFNFGSGADKGILSIAVQADGKVLIGGLFTTYNGTPRKGIARLHVDGSLDTTFDAGPELLGSVRSISVNPGGRILIGGSFSLHSNGTTRAMLARLNVDGSLDASFNGWPDGTVNTVVEANGKVLIGGTFTNCNGVVRSGVASLNADGSLDTGFDSELGANGSVTSVVVQHDHKVIIGGWFNSYSDTTRNGLARLNADGSLDTTYDPDIREHSKVNFMTLTLDGRLLIGGEFDVSNGRIRTYLASFDDDGSLTHGFNTYSTDDVVHAVLEQEIYSEQDQQTVWKLLVGGEGFTAILRLDSEGFRDASFKTSTGVDDVIYSVAVQADEKLLIGGLFANYDDKPSKGIARLNADGTLDTTFNPGTGANGSVLSIAVERDRRILIGGSFFIYDGRFRVRIARMNADGSVDTSFNPGSGANGNVTTIALQTDGKILIGGWFTSYNGTARNRIARLNTDGSLDTTFNPGTGADYTVQSMALQADGKLLIGGWFTSYNGTARRGIARLNADGSLDTSFNPSTAIDKWVQSIALQADGKVLVSVNFYSAFAARNQLTRLNTDGSLDTSFDPGTGANRFVESIALQANGKVLIGGDFTSYNGTARKGIARLNVDGSLDTSFDPGIGPNGHVRSISLQADGHVLIGGLFTSYNGTERVNLARIFNNPAIRSIAAPDHSSIAWLRGGTAPEVEQVSFDFSTNGMEWTAIGNAYRTGSGWELSGVTLPASGLLRARGRSSAGLNNGSSSIIEQVAVFPIVDLPTVTTSDIAGITTDSADGGGNVVANGGAPVTERGLVYATTTDPTVSDTDKVVSGSGPGEFKVSLTGLAPGTTYYVRAFATNSGGTAYGPQVVFSTTTDSTLHSFANAMLAAGLTASDALPDAIPFGDGVPNLLKFAFNMKLDGNDSHGMATGGSSGLPLAGLAEENGQSVWRVEYLVRKNSGLVYVPQKSSGLAPDSFSPLIGRVTEEDINADWKRIVITEPIDDVNHPKFFTRILVTMP
jgi:uncharacterized delta-60 repeat protein